MQGNPIVTPRRSMSIETVFKPAGCANFDVSVRWYERLF